MSLIVNVACMGEMNHAYKLLFRKPEQKRELGTGAGGRIILKWYENAD
jgi:hypothetical protein